ncbi:MAG: hypothetical protein KC467_16130, partial [Marinomonas atlantica]|nr:hypothetical protein [Marinomonas atlantica]
IDHQVKLHGQRLELEEIEQAIAQLDDVCEAVVLLHKSVENTQKLHAFVCLSDVNKTIAPENWRARLADQLPLYMIPADITVVESIPVTHTGKLDRNLLLSLLRTSKHSSSVTRPLAGIETQVAEVWRDLLSVDIYREDHFFAIGGNSLLAVTVAHRISKQLNLHVVARDLFAAPTLAGFSEKVAGAEVKSNDALQRSDVATASECEFWTAEKAGLDTRTFIILVQQKVQGQAPLTKEWDAAWEKIVMRHGALRTFYREDSEGLLRRRLVSDSTTKLTHTVVADNAAMIEMMRKWQSEPLRMDSAPLWRAGVISERATGTTTFWLAMHHAVGDGHSVAILLNEIAMLIEGENPALPQTDLDESGAAYNTYLKGRDAKQDREYWHHIMAPVPDKAFDEWSLDYSREDTNLIGTHRFKAYVDKEIATGLFKLASEHEASIHALMLTLLAFETRRRTGREDFVLGTTASSRETIEDNDVVGCFVNMLPIPYTSFDINVFGDLLKITQKELMAALQYARFPFSQIYHDVWAKRPQLRHPLRFPLFDLVVTENPSTENKNGIFSADSVIAGNLEYEFTDWPPGQDMVLIHERQPDGSLMLEWHVNAEVYQRSTSQVWFQSLLSWSNWLGEKPTRAGEPLPTLLPEEVLCLSSWEMGPVISRPSQSVHEMFEERVALHPQKIAFVSGDETISYGELNHQANRIAHALLTS